MFEISAQQHLLPIVVFLTMMTIGLELSVRQFRELFREPRVPVLGTLIHTFTFPVIALALVLSIEVMEFETTEAMLIGILLIAACPSGGFSNILTLIARANLTLSIVLTAVSTIFSMVTVPLLLYSFGYFVVELQTSVVIPVADVLLQLVLLIFLPVVIGMFVTAKFNLLSDEQILKYQKSTQLMLYALTITIVIESWDVMQAGLVDALPLSVLLCMANISICFTLSRLFGLEPVDAVTVAMEGSTRNIAVAILIAATTLERMDVAVLPTVYFISILMVSIVFAKTWRKFLIHEVRDPDRIQAGITEGLEDDRKKIEHRENKTN